MSLRQDSVSRVRMVRSEVRPLTAGDTVELRIVVDSLRGLPAGAVFAVERDGVGLRIGMDESRRQVVAQATRAPTVEERTETVEEVATHREVTDSSAVEAKPPDGGGSGLKQRVVSFWEMMMVLLVSAVIAVAVLKKL